MKKKILIVIGTRPNFMKVTRFKEVAAAYPGFEVKIVHTGQHYDNNMSEVFFEQFKLVPDFFLNISAGSPNSQMTEIMTKLEELFRKTFMPDLLLVVGDVNSTLAAALVANNMKIKLAHVESGLRSFDRTMPEEINRILTDEMAGYFFVTEESGSKNLLRERKNKENIFMVGNTMIDTLAAFEHQIDSSSVMKKYDLQPLEFVLMTIHRPATVDSLEGLEKLLELIDYLSEKYKIVFPIHPRTINNLRKFGLSERIEKNKQLLALEPMDYFAFQKLVKNCNFILTDSGGIQEESTWLLKPCLTLRPNTERPVTCSLGTNTLLPFNIEKIKKEISAIESGNYKKGIVPDLWDGKSTERIFVILNSILG